MAAKKPLKLTLRDVPAWLALDQQRHDVLALVSRTRSDPDAIVRGPDAAALQALVADAGIVAATLPPKLLKLGVLRRGLTVPGYVVAATILDLVPSVVSHLERFDFPREGLLRLFSARLYSALLASLKGSPSAARQNPLPRGAVLDAEDIPDWAVQDEATRETLASDLNQVRALAPGRGIFAIASAARARWDEGNELAPFVLLDLAPTLLWPLPLATPTGTWIKERLHELVLHRRWDLLLRMAQRAGKRGSDTDVLTLRVVESIALQLWREATHSIPDMWAESRIPAAEAWPFVQKAINVVAKVDEWHKSGGLHGASRAEEARARVLQSLRRVRKLWVQTTFVASIGTYRHGKEGQGDR